MKWLKLFESFTNNEYYQEVSGEDYTFDNDKIVNMSDKMKDKIASWFSIDNRNTTFYSRRSITISGNLGFLYVYELEDEWFDVSFVNLNNSNTFFYKCDQLEGLKKFFTDKGFIQ